ncbi:MAG: TRAP transporter large permease subunit, partial [Chloroflexota bacterium]
IRELIVKRGRVDFKLLALSFERPPRQMMEIIGSLVMIGVIVYCVEVTGLGTKMSMAMIDWAGGNIYLLLFFTMLASLILGLALPSIACYIFLAVLAAPALVGAGILPLAAHMFVFYFGVVSGITPPVGTPFFVAAGIAGADPMKTGWQAMKLGIAGYVSPFMFALSPTILLQGGSPLLIVRDCVSLMVAAFGLACAVEGYCFRRIGVLRRVLFGVAGCMLVVPDMVTDAIGYALLALLVVLEVLAWKRSRAMEAGADHPT